MSNVFDRVIFEESIFFLSPPLNSGLHSLNTHEPHPTWAAEQHVPLQTPLILSSDATLMLRDSISQFPFCLAHVAKFPRVHTCDPTTDFDCTASAGT